nr:alpha/beta hydrolase [Leifsonia sp. fls2-241-R2A-40a]
MSETDDPRRLVPGDLEDIDDLAKRWRHRSTELRDHASGSRSLGLDDAWRGRTADAYRAALAGHTRQSEHLGDAYAGAADALIDVADALRTARGLAAHAAGRWHDAEAAARAARALDARLDVPFGSLVDEPGGEDRLAAVRELDRAREHLRETEQAAIRALGSAGLPPSSSVYANDLPATAAFAALLPNPPFPTALRQLAAAGPDELRGRADGSERLLAELLALGPETIAAWWATLTPHQRDALAAALPRVVGNLDGLPAADRSAANHRVLRDDLARRDGDVAAAKAALAGLGDDRSAAFLAATEQVRRCERDRRELRAIISAYGEGPAGDPPHELYAYHSGPPARAAVVTGLLERAANVSVIVPGMGTTAADIVAYSGAAQRLREAQHRVAGVSPGEVAVIAWLDYDAPGPSDVQGVLQDTRAAAGGARLGDCLRGLRASLPEGSALSVVAHSYGTDVAAHAVSLPRVEADHLVMLGSAGIPRSLGRASDLHVAPGEVFASQGERDGWAPVGQSLSGRTDPTGPAFGAHVFTSEDSVLNGESLKGVDRHGPFGDPGGGITSYFDAGSSALHGAALATMGLGEELAVGGTPSERAGAGR